jgi:hypothetical protein
VGIAFFIAYTLIPDAYNASMAPTKYWHWLPYLAGVAMLTGALSLAHGLVILERWMLYLLLGALAAWLLVPTWRDLEPPRTTYVPLLAGYFVLLAVLIDPLPARFSPRIVDSSMCLAAACTAVAVWAAISETYGRVGAVAAPAWAGACLANWFVRSSTSSRAAAPLYAVLVGGIAFVGFVYPPEKAEWVLLVIPALPLALWITTFGPLARLSGRRAAAVQIASVLIPLAVAAVVVARG